MVASFTANIRNHFTNERATKKLSEDNTCKALTNPY